MSKKPKFDWHGAPLTMKTPITEDDRNTQNVRRFFLAHAGDHFRFNVVFMKWMKTSVGQTRGDALAEWKAHHDPKARG